MKYFVKNFVITCDTYQHHKGETIQPFSLLHPLLIPMNPWKDISLNFIEGIPHSIGKSLFFFFYGG